MNNTGKNNKTVFEIIDRLNVYFILTFQNEIIIYPYSIANKL